jgi:signal transduction histidine kinase
MSARGRLLIPVVVAFLIQVPVTLVDVRLRAGERPIVHATSFGDVWLPLLIALVGPVALLFARRFPGPVVAVTAAAAVADLLLFESRFHPPYIALAFAIVSAVVRGARLWAWISVAAAWLVAFGLAALLHLDPSPPRIAALTLGVLIVMGIGEGLRTRRERFRERAREYAERKQNELQLERVRIARELHDVLAHSLSQINVQAGVGLHLMDRQPDKAREALANIKESSRTALQEVRGVLGILRADDGTDVPLSPEPDLAMVPALIDSTRAQGVAITFDNGIASSPGSAVQLALYRLVQESLTNVLRHASRSDGAAVSVDIRLTEADDGVLLTVTDDGDSGGDSSGGGGGDNGNSGGRGLLGMTERAQLLGGSLDAGRQPGGGFRVSARIPNERARR